MSLTLYQSPGACSRVTMSALEELGLDYDDVLVDLAKGAHKSADYLQINPRGKVPALRIGEQLLTQNAMILWTLDRMFGPGHLLPDAGADPLRQHEQLADLCWCADTLHPMIRQVRNPQRFTDGDLEGVRADGSAKLTVECDRLSRRIGDRWWYGDAWSIVDAYVAWALGTAAKGGFPLRDFPALVDHGRRTAQRPSMLRALAREERSITIAS